MECTLISCGCVAGDMFILFLRYIFMFGLKITKMDPILTEKEENLGFLGQTLSIHLCLLELYDPSFTACMIW